MQMFIVARRHPELYDYLSAQFADDPTVTVVLDRRLASRRLRALPAAAERRRIDRRWRPEVDEQLRATPLAIVTAATTAEPGRGAPASEARQWVEALHRGVKAVHSALDEHERLQLEVQVIRQDHSRLQTEAQVLKQDNERLRAEIDLSRRELTALDIGLGHALVVVSELRSRLNKEPDRYPTE